MLRKIAREAHEQALGEAKLEQRRTEERVQRGEEAYAALEDDLAGANAELDRTHTQLRAAREACVAAEQSTEDERARHERELAQLRGVWPVAFSLLLRSAAAYTKCTVGARHQYHLYFLN